MSAECIRRAWALSAGRFLAGACVALAACGTSNPTLKVEHAFLDATERAADETITVATLAETVSVTSPFNVRYTITAAVPAGRYVLKGADAAGKYYASRDHSFGVTLTLAGFTVLSKPKPERVKGGIYVDSAGAGYVYWFQNDDDKMPVRIAAPGMRVSIAKEVDPDLTRARLDKQEKEAQERSERERKANLASALAAARLRNRTPCSGPAQCDRAFALAQEYLLSLSDMRIQVATPTLIETYNANDAGKMQMRVTRVPTAGDRWDIVLSASCRAERREDLEPCELKLLSAYDGFLPHIQGRLR